MDERAKHQRLVSTARVIAVTVACLVVSFAWAGEAKPLTVIEGKLVTTRGDCPVLQIGGREQPLSGKTPFVFHTLQDKRLDGRQVRLEGVVQGDGAFEVQWLYTLHDGKIFKVRYFCRTCNIVALEPGNCVCCQQPTELQEIEISGPPVTMSH